MLLCDVIFIKNKKIWAEKFIEVGKKQRLERWVSHSHFLFFSCIFFSFPKIKLTTNALCRLMHSFPVLNHSIQWHFERNARPWRHNTTQFKYRIENEKKNINQKQKHYPKKKHNCSIVGLNGVHLKVFSFNIIFLGGYFINVNSHSHVCVCVCVNRIIVICGLHRSC